VAHARRRPSDGGAQDRLQDHLGAGPDRRRPRGRHFVPREATGRLPDEGVLRHGIVLPVVGGEEVRVMDFEIPADIVALLERIDDFIAKEIKPLEQQDADNGGIPRKEWYELLGEMRRRADAAGLLRWALPSELGGSDGSNLGMAII